MKRTLRSIMIYNDSELFFLRISFELSLTYRSSSKLQSEEETSKKKSQMSHESKSNEIYCI